LGVIDTLSAGFRLVSRRVWLLLLPVAMDLFLLLGPKLSVLPVVTAAYDSFVASQDAAIQAGGQAIDETMLSEIHSLVSDVVGRVNLFGLGAWSRLGFPSVAGTRPIDASDTVHTVTSTREMIAWEIGILAIGLLATSAFLVLIANAVREGHASSSEVTRSILSSWGRLLSLVVPFGMGVLAAATLLALLPGVGLMLLMALSIGLVWMAIYLAFVPQAITLADSRALGALSNSFVLVRNNFMASIGLLALVVLLRNGLGLVWGRLLLRSQLGAVIAIVGNAYVGTGLTAAMFFFYRDRMATLRQGRASRSLRLR